MTDVAARERRLLLAARALVAAAVVVVVVRILLVPHTFGDPDRSRFLTVQSLVQDGTYAVGWRVPLDGGRYRDVGLAARAFTVDLMLDPETQRFYSSKPPLLPTLVAAEAWLLERTFGWRLDSPDATHVLRAVLLTFNALPFALYLWLLSTWLLHHRSSARAPLYVLALAGFGTFVTTFTTTLNNHTLAAFATLGAAVLTLRVFAERREGIGAWLLAGLLAGAAFTQELPALTLVAACFFLLSTVSRSRALLYFLPAALLPFLAWAATNAIALGDPWFYLRLPGDWFEYAGSYWQRPTGLDAERPSVLGYAFHFLVGHHGLLSLTPAFLLAFVEMGAPLWRGVRARTEPSRLTRAVGVSLLVILVLALLLLPAWLDKGIDLLDRSAAAPVLLLFGAVALLVPFGWWRDDERREEAALRLAAACVLPTLTFYVQETGNYGGITSGPRWLLWLTPLLLLLLPRPVAWLERTTPGRIGLFALLALSLFSVWWPGLNPYRHPWLYELLVQR